LFTNNAFLQFPERIKDLAEDNDRERLQARGSNAAICYATFVRSGSLYNRAGQQLITQSYKTSKRLIALEA
jgi:hypothetical protein